MKLQFIMAYIATNSFEIVCLSETFLDSIISNYDSRTKIAGYSLLRADYLNNTIYKTCHQNLIFGKINFNIPLHQPFYRDIWDYNGL